MLQPWPKMHPASGEQVQPWLNMHPPSGEQVLLLGVKLGLLWCLLGTLDTVLQQTSLLQGLLQKPSLSRELWDLGLLLPHSSNGLRLCEDPGEQHILLPHKLLHWCQAIEGYLHHLLAQPDINL